MRSFIPDLISDLPPGDEIFRRVVRLSARRAGVVVGGDEGIAGALVAHGAGA